MCNLDLIEKIAKAERWQLWENETLREAFERQGIRPTEVPDATIVDVVLAGGLQEWANELNPSSLDELTAQVREVFILATTASNFDNKHLAAKMRVIAAFCQGATRVEKNLKSGIEAAKIAEFAWFSHIQPRRLKERTEENFKKAPNADKYRDAANKLKEIYNFSTTTIDALRYFVCQCRNLDHDPSLNKALYFYSEKKQTGKTTLARTFAAVLNGAKKISEAAQFESTFACEMQLNDHDLPKAAQYNCIILDEAMPKDSRKSYGMVKSKITSNSCRYNQKFGRIVDIPARRNYIFTSNEPINEFIQDDTERRFIEVVMREKPKQLKQSEIFDTVLIFCQNCTHEPNIPEWYSSFNEVEGLQRKEVEEYKVEILSHGMLERIKGRNGRQIGQKMFDDYLLSRTANRDEKTTIRKAVIELFGEPMSSGAWAKNRIVEALSAKIEAIDNEINQIEVAEIRAKLEAENVEQTQPTTPTPIVQKTPLKTQKKGINGVDGKPSQVILEEIDPELGF